MFFLATWCCISLSLSFFIPSLSPLPIWIGPLVVALQSLHHEQLPKILRSEFLYVLAVVVDLSCWRGTALHPHSKETETQKTHRRVDWSNRRGGGRAWRGQKQNMELEASKLKLESEGVYWSKWWWAAPNSAAVDEL